MASSIPNASAAPRKFQLLTDTDIEALPDPCWLIEKIMVERSLAILYGPPGAGKTFVALSWAFSVAANRIWFGKRVAAGRVLYIAAEGGVGIKLRIMAWKKNSNLQKIEGIRLVNSDLQFLESGEIDSLIKELESKSFRPSLIVVDTLARCAVGADENSAKDMGRFIAGVDRLRHKFGATALVIHHTTKNELNERGSSALRAAADTMISCGEEAGAVSLECKKQKDAAPFSTLALNLEKVSLPGGQSSLVLGSFADAIKKAQSGGPDKKQVDALKILSDYGPEGATATEWQRQCEPHGIPHKTFYTKRKALLKGGYVEKPGDHQGGQYRITDKGRELLPKALPGSANKHPPEPVSCRVTPLRGDTTGNGGDTNISPAPTGPAQRPDGSPPPMNPDASDDPPRSPKTAHTPIMRPDDPPRPIAPTAHMNDTPIGPTDTDQNH